MFFILIFWGVMIILIRFKVGITFIMWLDLMIGYAFLGFLIFICLGPVFVRFISVFITCLCNFSEFFLDVFIIHRFLALIFVFNLSALRSLIWFSIVFIHIIIHFVRLLELFVVRSSYSQYLISISIVALVNFADSW